MDAINKGKIHLAKFILDAGEYDIVNTRDFKGKTPLIRACYIKVNTVLFCRNTPERRSGTVFSGI